MLSVWRKKRLMISLKMTLLMVNRSRRCSWKFSSTGSKYCNEVLHISVAVRCFYSLFTYLHKPSFVRSPRIEQSILLLLLTDGFTSATVSLFCFFYSHLILFFPTWNLKGISYLVWINVDFPISFRQILLSFETLFIIRLYWFNFFFVSCLITLVTKFSSKAPSTLATNAANKHSKQTEQTAQTLQTNKILSISWITFFPFALFVLFVHVCGKMLQVWTGLNDECETIFIYTIQLKWLLQRTAKIILKQERKNSLIRWKFVKLRAKCKKFA